MLDDAMAEHPLGVSVATFGAAGDGVGDDTAAIQAAIDSIAGTGGSVLLPPGRYRVGALSLPAGVSLRGTYTFASLSSGSWLHCVDVERPAITVASGTSVQSLGFYYPEQRWDAQKAAPGHIYPPSILVTDGARRVLVRDVFFVNTYEAINADRHHEYLILQNVQGYAIHRGVVEDMSSDIDRWTTVHFNINCFWVADDPDTQRFAQWTRTHGTAFTIRRADWLVMFDCFCWGYRTGLRLEDSPADHGSPGGVHVVCCGFDACGVCVHMTGGWGVRISDTFFVSFNAFEPGADTDAAAVVVSGGGEVGLKNSRWWGCDHGAAVLRCSNAVVEGNGFMDFARRAAEEGREYAALVLDAGVHQVTGNQFSGTRFDEATGGPTPNRGAYGVEVLPAAAGAVISGNSFAGLDGGSIRVGGGVARLAMHSNLHRASRPALATDEGPGVAGGDVVLDA